MVNPNQPMNLHPFDDGETTPVGKTTSSIGLDHLREHGEISQKEAQALHGALCHQTGVTDPDQIVAEWNDRSPLAPWNCPESQFKGSPYANELTSYLLAYMATKVADAQNDAKHPPTPPNAL